MSQALENIELASLHFAPPVLVLGGIIVVAAGLFAWLGGLRWSMIVAAILGSLVGLSCALLFTDRSIVPIALLTVVPAAFASFLKKPLIIMAGGGFAAVGCIVFFTGLSLENVSLRPPEHPMPYKDGQRSAISVEETAAEIKTEVLFWVDALEKSAEQITPTAIALGGGAAILVVGTGFIFPRLIASLTCASMGTALITAGMVFALLYKGARPLTHLYNKGAFFGVVILAMIAFGTFSQLILCPGKAKKPDMETQTRGGK